MTNQFENINTSLLEEPLRRFMEDDPTLRLIRVARILQSTVVSTNENTSVSVMRRKSSVGGNNNVIIGTKPWSEEAVRRWGVGTNDKSEQIIIKLSHELAHAFQSEMGFEQSLVDFLNGHNDIPEYTIPYIELYAILSGVGTINGLTREPIYAEQSRTTGNLKMETLEEITELISSYMISDEYYLFRLENSVTSLDYDTKEMISRKVVEVCTRLH